MAKKLGFSSERIKEIEAPSVAWESQQTPKMQKIPTKLKRFKKDFRNQFNSKIYLKIPKNQRFTNIYKYQIIPKYSKRFKEIQKEYVALDVKKELEVHRVAQVPENYV